MSLSGNTRTPSTPTPPQGEVVASYATYLEAQKAVDHLADSAFAVQLVTIVGTDLKMVERVTGRLSYPRVALGGFLSGAWFGLFVGLLLSLFSAPGTQSPLVPAIFIGGAFGLLFAVLTYSFSRGKRDFTSTSQIVASSYAVLCRQEQAHKARELLREIGGVQSGWPARPAAPVTTTNPSDPSGTYPQAPSSQPWGSPSVPPVGPPAPPAPPSGPPADQPGNAAPPSGPPTGP
ncbi:general stress protein [Cellulomonas fengjieae]|uniref:ECF transporter S component n=1 Tax=Cellulomonas fengjieae TaxID=2819978 RepID=A0ABS3SEG5_9CELL|nr:general stress protein [Cellulomonas fengjieae]MBO3083704.1 ECF transporter S component [Cellulomonas fengjieae]MBO3101545.1 ECF transporter S component [Cellulomonas fengjieae]QVI64990.1 ECF transporter S component [Cellulomonas fengjieae]